jgi:hypothetical protein
LYIFRKIFQFQTSSKLAKSSFQFLNKAQLEFHQVSTAYSNVLVTV